MTRREWLGDATFAAALGALVVAVTAFALDDVSPVDRLVGPVAVGLAATASASLVVRRRAPLVALLVTTVAATAYLVGGWPYGPVLLTVAVAAYTVARHRPVRTATRASLAALAVLLVHVPFNEAALDGWLALLPAAAWVLVPLAVGVSLRTSDEAARRARTAQLRQHVDDERLRIAQEVHDVVGHGLAAVQMQADVALHVMDRDPHQARLALEAISRSNAAAFEELRATLHLLRGDEAPVAPTPGLAVVDELCARVRQAGVDVDLEVSGPPTPLPEEVDLAAYRVLQEALTNVVRHGAVPRARARVTYAGAHVEVAVTNPGTVAPAKGEGSGRAGMQRRVAALAGTFRAGPTDDGFEVVARLPVAART